MNIPVAPDKYVLHKSKTLLEYKAGDGDAHVWEHDFTRMKR